MNCHKDKTAKGWNIITVITAIFFGVQMFCIFMVLYGMQFLERLQHIRMFGSVKIYVVFTLFYFSDDLSNTNRRIPTELWFGVKAY